MSKLKERRNEIRGMDMAGAQQELKDLRRRLFELRLQKERGEVKNNRQFMQSRADIARLMHHISELRHAERIEAEAGPEAEAEAQPTATAEQAPAARGRRARASAPATTEPATTTPETTATTTNDEDEEA